jgi:hypothetical protein
MARRLIGAGGSLVALGNAAACGTKTARLPPPWHARLARLEPRVHARTLPRATSSLVCVTLLSPDARVFIRNTGSLLSLLRVDLNYTGASGRSRTATVGLVAGGSSWSLSLPVLFLLDSITPIVGSGVRPGPASHSLRPVRPASGRSTTSTSTRSSTTSTALADREPDREARGPSRESGPLRSSQPYGGSIGKDRSLLEPSSASTSGARPASTCVNLRHRVTRRRKAPVLCTLTPSRRAKGGETFLRSTARAYPPPPDRCRGASRTRSYSPIEHS